MDPHNTTQMTAMQPFNFVYEKLLNRDKDMRLIPELAEAWKSLDPATWEILLRKGVKFHNGEDFNAEAVKFTLDGSGSPARQLCLKASRRSRKCARSMPTPCIRH